MCATGMPGADLLLHAGPRARGHAGAGRISRCVASHRGVQATNRIPLARNRPTVNWQRNFFDHLLRTKEDLAAHVRYVAENPVRKQLVAEWQEYPYTGSIGFDLDAILQSVATAR